MRENAYTKASRLLTEARLQVTFVNTVLVVGMVRGDSGERYEVACSPSGWTCTCPSFGRCSHIYALQRVTLKPATTNPQRAADFERAQSFDHPASSKPDPSRDTTFDGARR